MSREDHRPRSGSGTRRTAGRAVAAPRTRLRRRGRRAAVLVVVALPQHAAALLAGAGGRERAVAGRRLPAGDARRVRGGVGPAPGRPRAGGGGPPPRVAGARLRRGRGGGRRAAAVAGVAERPAGAGRHGTPLAGRGAAAGRRDGRGVRAPAPARSPRRPRGWPARRGAGPAAPPPAGPRDHRRGARRRRGGGLPRRRRRRLLLLGQRPLRARRRHHRPWRRAAHHARLLGQPRVAGAVGDPRRVRAQLRGGHHEPGAAAGVPRTSGRRPRTDPGLRRAAVGRLTRPARRAGGPGAGARRRLPAGGPERRHGDRHRLGRP